MDNLINSEEIPSIYVIEETVGIIVEPNYHRDELFLS